MENFFFQLPTRVFFGRGELKKLGSLAAQIGKKALLVTGKNAMRKTGILDRVMDILKQEGLDIIHFGQVEANPRVSTVERGTEIAQKEQCDMIIGLGGGSAIDAAKTIAVSCKDGGPIWEIVTGERKPLNALPVIAVTTTAGTGTEVDHIAVITNEKNHEKRGFAYSLMFPAVAIVDPELMVTVPPKVTAATGLDVFFHVLEGYINDIFNPLAEPLQLEAIKIVREALPKAYKDGQDLEARTKMAWANTIGGISLTLCGACGLHALEHPVSGYLDIPHGEGLAALALSFIDYSWPGAPEKFARVAEALGETITGLTIEEAAKKSIDGVRKLLQAVDMDINLATLGVSEKLIPEMARDVMNYGRKNFLKNPRDAQKEDVISLYKNSL